MPYLLDTKTLIEAKNMYYRFSFCPGFWDWILEENRRGAVFSVAAVKVEVMRGSDDLANRAAYLSDEFFLPKDIEVAAGARTISNWVTTRQFTTAAVQEFFAAADYWLVAHALAYGHVVVTRETPDPASKRRVKIQTYALPLGSPLQAPSRCWRTKVRSSLCLDPWAG